MSERGKLVSFGNYEWHKGFYNDENYTDTLIKIRYSDFFVELDNDEFPYDSAYVLLNGSCNHFAVSLGKIYGYNVYVIQQIDKKGFHAFCQIYQRGQWYYVDARGITSSFDEFIKGVRTFVGDEFTIRLMSDKDLLDTEKSFCYEGYEVPFELNHVLYRGYYYDGSFTDTESDTNL